MTTKFFLITISVLSVLVCSGKSQNYTYDALGRVVSVANSGRAASYVYDAAGNITSIASAASASLQNESFKRLADGNVEHTLDFLNANNNELQATAYNLPRNVVVIDVVKTSPTKVAESSETAKPLYVTKVVIQYTGVTGELSQFHPSVKLTTKLKDIDKSVAPNIREMQFANGKCRTLEFASVPGKSYAIECSEDAATWHRVGEPLKAEHATSQWQNALQPESLLNDKAIKPLFYRVVSLS